MTLQTNDPQANGSTQLTIGPDSDDREVTYRCPFCHTTYNDERLVRVHVTRSDDEAHTNYNGLMPETAVEVVDDSGTVIDRVSREPDEIDLKTVTRSDLPEDLTPKQTVAVLAATHHPYKGDHTALTEIIKRDYSAEEGLPAYETVNEAVRAFYRPQDTHAESEETLADLTPKQQAVLLVRVADPNLPKAAIARQVGCASSYPRQVFERAGHVLSDLRAKQANHDDLASLLKAELSADDIAELRDHLGGVAEFDWILEDFQDDGEQVEPDARWGDPVTTQSGLRATPSISETPDTTAEAPEDNSTEKPKRNDDASGGENSSADEQNTEQDDEESPHADNTTVRNSEETPHSGDEEPVRNSDEAVAGDGASETDEMESEIETPSHSSGDGQIVGTSDTTTASPATRWTDIADLQKQLQFCVDMLQRTEKSDLAIAVAALEQVDAELEALQTHYKSS